MKINYHKILIFVLPLFLGACTVTNNLYLNDAVPLEKEEGEFFLGVGSGLQPAIDEITEDGDVVFSDSLKAAPNLVLSLKGGLGKNFTLNFGVHLPYILSGFGMNFGTQYSFFPKESRINVAPGINFGFVISRTELFNEPLKSVPPVSGAMNLDLYLPFSFVLKENYRLILTPRLSSNIMFIKKNVDFDDNRWFKPMFQIYSAGLRLNKIYIEASAIYFKQKLLPNAGIAFVFGEH